MESYGRQPSSVEDGTLNEMSDEAPYPWGSISHTGRSAFLTQELHIAKFANMLSESAFDMEWNLH